MLPSEDNICLGSKVKRFVGFVVQVPVSVCVTLCEKQERSAYWESATTWDEGERCVLTNERDSERVREGGRE